MGVEGRGTSHRQGLDREHRQHRLKECQEKMAKQAEWDR